MRFPAFPTAQITGTLVVEAAPFAVNDVILGLAVTVAVYDALMLVIKD